MSSIVSVFFEPLTELLNVFQSERHHKDGKKDEALQAIYSALIETKKYVELSSGVENREKEYELAQLWAKASIKARYASEELAGRLGDKSKLWSDSVKWSREEILSKEIDFQSIENTLTSLLTD